jgi:Na+/melibiose symporter-like transporter
MGVAGPILSGLVCKRYGAAAGIGVNAMSFVMSAVSMAFVRLNRGENPTREHSVSSSAFARDGRFASYLVGVRFIWRTPVLRAVALSLTATGFLMAARNDLLIFCLDREIGADPDKIGVVMGISWLGAIAASAFATTLHHRMGLGRSWLVAGILASVPIGCIGWLGDAITVPAVTAFLLVTAFGETLRAIVSQSLRHQVTPDGILGRVTAAFWVIIDVPVVLGAVAMTALATRVGTSVAFEIAAVGGLVVVVAAARGIGDADPRESWQR